jgi:DNA repair protein RecO (recombination protein O)
MAPLTSDALVLRSYPLREQSRIVVLLTRERGKVRGVARGARGPRNRIGAALEPLSEVRVSLYGRQGAELVTIGAWEMLSSTFAAGARDPEAAMTLSYLADLIDAFSVEGEAEDNVYRLARTLAGQLASEVPPACLARYGEAWILRLHGIFPSLSRCAACSAALGGGELRYDERAHGFLCDGCGRASGPMLPESARAALLRFFTRSPADSAAIEAGAVAALEPFHQKLITRHLEREVRSYRVLRDVVREIHR